MYICDMSTTESTSHPILTALPPRVPLLSVGCFRMFYWQGLLHIVVQHVTYGEGKGEEMV